MTLPSDRYIIETYREYVGIKLHFNDNKFIYKNHSQFTRLKTEQLKNRNDKEWFFRLARRFNNDPNERFNFIVSQFKENKDVWIGDFFKDSSDKIFHKRMRIMNSFQYYVEKDIDDIILKYEGFSLESILNVNYDRPLIYKEMNLNDETYAILDKLFKFDDNSSNPLWNNKLFMCRKYYHFLKLDDEFLLNIKTKLENSFESNKNNVEKNSLNENYNNDNTLDYLFN